MKKTKAYMPRPGHTCRVKKPGDPWNRKQVAVSVVSKTGASVCVLWTALNSDLQSPFGSACRKKLVRREYMPSELAYVDLKMEEAYKTRVGKSYVFFRNGHDWNGCEVIVISKSNRGYRVSRCCWVAEFFFNKSNPNPPPKQWTAYKHELI